MRIKKITCIQLDGEFPDFCHRLVMPDYGLPLIGTILLEAGYDVKVYVEHVKPPEWGRISESDFICFSTLTAAAGKTYRFADEIRSRFGIPIIVGGTHASYFPESCLQHCDYVVFGEGDETIVELIETLSREGDVSGVAGIGYRIGNRSLRTAPRQGPTRLDTVPNYSLIDGYSPMSSLDILLQLKRPLLTIQYSRGCPHKCTFCIVNTMFESGYRTRDIESVIRDLKDKRRYSRSLMFVDNDFAAVRPRTKKLLRRMIDEDLGYDEIVVFTRVEASRDDELLELMRHAGVTRIYQGYESIQPETLAWYEKHQYLEQIIASIEKLHSFGFGILGSFVVGADSDTMETITRTVDFVLEQKLSNAYLFPIWGHYPEKRNGYRTIIPWYRSIFRGWGFCNGHFVTHFPARMPPSQFQKAIVDAYRMIYSPRQILDAVKRLKFDDAISRLSLRYAWQDIEKSVLEYVPFLQELEAGLYDDTGRLSEDLLIKRIRGNWRWSFQEGNRTLEALGLSPLELPDYDEKNITCMPVRPN